MNTPTLITLIIFAIALIWLLIATIKKQRVTTDATEKRILLFTIGLMVFVIVITITIGLNTFGIGRLPLMNEVKSRLPESFTANDRPINPPVNRSIQPPSQQMFEDHQRQMEKLKRDGL